MTKKKQIAFALPLRDIVMFPHMAATILVGRKKSIKSINEAKKNQDLILAVAQTNPDHDDFDKKNIYDVGVLCEIIEISSMPDGTLKIIIQGIRRAKIVKIVADKNAFKCQIEILQNKDSKESKDQEILGLIKSNVENFAKLGQYNKRITQDVLASLMKLKSPYDICDSILSFVNNSVERKQIVLQENDLSKKLYKTLELVKTEFEIAQTEVKINRVIQEKFAKSQKNFYLLEQMRQIKKELGQDDDENEVETLRKKIAKLKLSKEVRKKCDVELAKLEKMNPYGSETSVVRNYLELIIQLPWNKESKVNKDFSKAQKILDKSHYGLEKIKERILEFIAVQIKAKNPKGSILCFVGAPGVGKTSLAKSIAESLGRKYEKISLGGVRDESEIRGHRRTYIGSMPGKVIQSIKKAQFSNPLILLDEIDKMSYDLRGDPSSALLEVLDPEQNSNFCDHYLEVEYDLSKVMFIATANDVSKIPTPLRDRMEIINLSGYMESEKFHIAKKYLLAKQMAANGLNKNELEISDDAFIKIIQDYTFEAGVRNLNRQIDKIARKSAKQILTKKSKKIKITPKNLKEYLGVKEFSYGKVREDDLVGVVTGLAYTQYGGDLLDIEALKFGGGTAKIQITGNLGDVMTESVNAALSYVRSILSELKIDAKQFAKTDFHVHVPEGATPKDGPSAGVAMCVALASTLSGKKIKKDIAMTGEITLSGRVLPIGGLKEKLLAALRGKIKTVLIPKQNEKDLDEIPPEIIKGLNIKAISTVKEALDECLVGFKKNR